MTRPAAIRAWTVAQRGAQWGSAGFITALFAPWVALAGPTQRILLAIALLDVPLQIDENFAYLDDPASLGALGGFDVSLTTLALLGLYVGWFIERVSARNVGEPLAPFRLVRPLALYLFFAVVSAVVARDADLYARGLFLMVQLFLLFFYLVNRIRTREDVRFVVMMMLWGLLVESVVIVIIGTAAESVDVAGFKVFVDTSTQELGGPRFYGTLGSPINAAAYLELILAPALAVLATSLERRQKLLAGLGVVLGLIALVGTLSRAAWVATVVSMTITCLAFRRTAGRNAGRGLAAPLLFLAFLGVVLLVFQSTIATRLTGDDYGSARGRLPLAATALEIIGDSPLLGIGVNNYVAALPRYEATFTGEWLYTVHNKYLLVWAEAGLGGFVAFVWFLVSTVRRGREVWKRRDPMLSPLALGFTAAFVGQMGHMAVDIYSSRSEVSFLWIVAALIAVMHRISTPPVRLAPR
ncbi:MAG TPA: O-antigen ligase family protein [Vicinamibacterales bacterium]|jgi:O-antigen ligase